MAMSEEEILREAGRIRANRRLRVAKTCERCGTNFEGLTRAKYCSDACRMAAGRDRQARPAPDPEHVVYIEGRRAGESVRDYMIRMRAKLVAQGKMTEEQAAIGPEDERQIAASERLNWLRDNLFRDDTFEVDSTEILRREREERSRYQASLHGIHVDD